MTTREESIASFKVDSWSPEELRWDYHTCKSAELRKVFKDELARRGLFVYGFGRRRGGPFVPGMTYFKTFHEKGK